MPRKSSFPAKYRNELRRAIALNGYNKICFQKQAMKMKSQINLLGQLYHGDQSQGIVSLFDLALAGEESFGELWDINLNVVTDAGFEGSSSHQLILKPLLHNTDSTFISGTHINKDIMTRSTFGVTSPRVTGRTLMNNAKDALCNLKKACAFGSTLINNDGTPVKSGDTIADLLHKVLNHMYVMNKGKENCLGDDTDDNTIEDNTTEEEKEQGGANQEEMDQTDNIDQPIDWIFEGYFAFFLWGVFADEDKRIDFISIGDDPVKAKGGRAKARAEERKENDEQCERDLAGRKRGATLGHTIALANLELASHQKEKDNKEMKLIAYKLQLDIVANQIARFEKRNERDGDDKWLAKVVELEKKEEIL